MRERTRKTELIIIIAGAFISMLLLWNHLDFPTRIHAKSFANNNSEQIENVDYEEYLTEYSVEVTSTPEPDEMPDETAELMELRTQADEVESAIEEETSAEDVAEELSEEEVEMLACTIYCEAGGDYCSDLCRKYVGDVVLNRIEDSRFPDTMVGVLTAENQYGRFYWTGIVWPERASDPLEANAVERAYRIARELLSGEHSELFGEGYIWQAEFEQGKDIIFLDGIYFGR